jgi:alpha-1,3-mannosyltransferase
MEDILELIHQRLLQKADMTCAMDWIYGGATFYDVWVSRAMNGDQFFEVPQSGQLGV